MLHITDTKEFEKKVVNETSKPVLVDFYADWCGPCKMLGPIIEEVEKEAKDAKIVKVNVDNAQELAAKYGVMSIPTVFIFKNGKPVQQFVGVQQKDTLVQALTS